MGEAKPTQVQAFERFGDQELWYAEGADQSWSFPLHLFWKKDPATQEEYGHIFPACGTYKSQTLALQSLLQFHDVMGREDQWLVPRGIVETLLRKAPGITPYYYYRWPSDMPMLKPQSKSIRIEDNDIVTSINAGSPYDRFVGFLCQKHGLPNSIVRIVIRAMAADAPQWMLEHREPLDLGFVKLIALPFRSNWKQIVGHKLKHSKLIGLLSMKNYKERMAALEEAGLPEALCSEQNVGIARIYGGHMLDYVIEAIPGKTFKAKAVVVEVQRLACGNTNYVASYEKTVETLYDHICQALLSYLRKAAAPFAKVYERGCQGYRGFLPTTTNSVTVRGKPLSSYPVSVVVDDSHFRAGREDGIPSIVYPKAKKMSSLSDLPLTIEDVRERQEQRRLDEPRPEGTAGVPVLYGRKSRDPWQPVLPEPEIEGGIRTRLDRKRTL